MNNSENSGNSQNLLLFVILSVSILAGSYYLNKHFFTPEHPPQKKSTPQTQSKQKKEHPKEVTHQKSVPQTTSKTQKTPYSEKKQHKISVKQNIRKKQFNSQLISLHSPEPSDKSIFYFSPIGATIKKIQTSKYKENAEDNQKKRNLRLLDNNKQTIYITINGTAIDKNIRYRHVIEKNTVTFSAKNITLIIDGKPQVINIEKKYTIQNRYTQLVSFSVNGFSHETLMPRVSVWGSIGPYNRKKPVGIYDRQELFYFPEQVKKLEYTQIYFNEKAGFLNTKDTNETVTRIEDKKTIRSAIANPARIIGQKNRYCAQGLLFQTPTSVVFEKNNSDSFRMDFPLPEKSMKMFVGPINGKDLKTFHENFTQVHDMFPFFKVLVVSFRFLLNRLSGFLCLIKIPEGISWGLSIIIFTILLKIVISPLTKKTMESSKKMAALKPEMDRLKKLYANDMQKQQAEMMELYKKHNINPVAGCLPMLLQIPIFIGFLRTIPIMLELRQQEFLWIKDLSQPDTIFEFGFALPLLNWTGFNLLPLLMAISMGLQQKLSPMNTSMGSTGGNNQTQLMMKIMPVMLLFFFWKMPAGLTLYWTISNISSIVYLTLPKLMNQKQS
jgi:YidC/Oxa1 family membrane protein insertase